MLVAVEAAAGIVGKQPIEIGIDGEEGGGDGHRWAGPTRIDWCG